MEFKDYQWQQYVRLREWGQMQQNVSGGIALDALRIRRWGTYCTESLLDRLHDKAEEYETDARDAAYLAQELLDLWRES